MVFRVPEQCLKIGDLPVVVDQIDDRQRRRLRQRQRAKRELDSALQLRRGQAPQRAGILLGGASELLLCLLQGGDRRGLRLRKLSAGSGLSL